MNIPKITLKRQLLTRKKPDPGKFVFTGKPMVDEIEIWLFRYNQDECAEVNNIKPDDIPLLTDPESRYWLNIYGLNDQDNIARICKTLNIHDLVIQDILDVNQRPKYQEFDHFSFLTIKSTVPASENQVTEQISFVFGKNFLVSFQERKSDHFEHLRYRLRENKGILRQRGSDYLLFTLLEAILDNYFKTLETFSIEVEDLSFGIIKTDPKPSVLMEIEANKKYIQIIRKAIMPIKEFSVIVERGDSKLIEKRHLKYYFEIKDLCFTLLDNCDTIASSLESCSNLFFSVQNQKMNQVMKTLTIVATIFIPLTFIVGIYGMNFSYMPELGWKYGYAAIWLLMLIIFSGMIYVFRRKKWM